MSTAVILKRNVKKLGKVGDIVKVKDGYARNFLLPQGVAILATVNNLLKLKDNLEEMQAKAEAQQKEVESFKQQIESIGSVEIQTKVGPTGKLFGRITAQDIVVALQEKNISVSKKAVSLSAYPKGIDELGTYDIAINLEFDIMAKVSLIVSEEN